MLWNVCYGVRVFSLSLELSLVFGHAFVRVLL